MKTRILAAIAAVTMFGLAGCGSMDRQTAGTIGGAAVGVVPRAVIRDRYTGVEATRLMALIMLVISVGPMLAPLIGSLLLQFGNWRLIFGALLLVALMSLMVTLFALPETLAPKDRIPVNVRSMGKGLRRLLGSPSFMGLTMVGAFGFGRA